jgi:hypothetical protein
VLSEPRAGYVTGFGGGAGAKKEIEVKSLYLSLTHSLIHALNTGLRALGTGDVTSRHISVPGCEADVMSRETSVRLINK